MLRGLSREAAITTRAVAGGIDQSAGKIEIKNCFDGNGGQDSNVNALFPVTMCPDCLGFDLLQAPLTLNRVALDVPPPPPNGKLDGAVIKVGKGAAGWQGP